MEDLNNGSANEQAPRDKEDPSRVLGFPRDDLGSRLDSYMIESEYSTAEESGVRTDESVFIVCQLSSGSCMSV